MKETGYSLLFCTRFEAEITWKYIRKRSYLELFAKGEYRLELLFGERDIARAAAASPEAQWKLANLRKMKR